MEAEYYITGLTLDQINKAWHKCDIQFNKWIMTNSGGLYKLSFYTREDRGNFHTLIFT